MARTLRGRCKPRRQTPARRATRRGATLRAVTDDREDPFGRRDDPPSPFGAPKHDWLPPSQSPPPAQPAGVPEAPAGWQPPGDPRGGWTQTPTGPVYQQPGGGSGGGSGEGNGKATASLVLGIAGLIICPLVCSVLALVFGYQARSEIDRTGQGQSSRGSATAGIVLGWVGIALSVVFVIVMILLIAVAGVEDTSPDGGFDGDFSQLSTIRVLAGAVGMVLGA